MPSLGLKPFWRYYGGKWRAAPRYPPPQHRVIIEPFAGAAGYAMRYPHLGVILVEKYPIVAEIWRYLIGAKPAEIRRIPCVDCVDDLPSWVPLGARYLVGFAMNAASVSPRRNLSAGLIEARRAGKPHSGWSEAQRNRVANQVEAIRHWTLLEGDYTSAPDIQATWFVDPPYNNAAGSLYVHSDVDYTELGRWCQSRDGQVIVCENQGAKWLPFKEFATTKAGPNSNGSKEVMWCSR